MKRRIVLWALLVLVVLVGLWSTWPPYREHRRRDQAITQLERIVGAVQLYATHTGQLPPDLNALVANPGVIGWQGPYLRPEELQTPWGDRYVLDAERGLVGISPESRKAPPAVRLGGPDELALPVREDPLWWPTR